MYTPFSRLRKAFGFCLPFFHFQKIDDRWDSFRTNPIAAWSADCPLRRIVGKITDTTRKHTIIFPTNQVKSWIPQPRSPE